MEFGSQQPVGGKSETVLTNTLSDGQLVEELRRQPRVDTNIGLEATTEEGNSAIAVVSNLSLSGCRLESSRKFIDTILPNINCPEKHPPNKVLLTFPLSSSTEATPNVVTVRCAIVYTKRLSPKSYQVGCQFKEFYGNSRQRLQGYLSTVEPNLAHYEHLNSLLPYRMNIPTQGTHPNFCEGLSDIYQALVIALNIKASEQDHLDHRIGDLIKSLIYAKEHFLKAQEALHEKEQDPETLLASSRQEDPLPGRLQSTSLTDEELKYLLD